MDSFQPYQPESYRQLVRRSLALYRICLLKTIKFALCFAFIIFIPRFIDALSGQESIIPGHLFNTYHLLLILIDFIALPFFIAIIWHMHCESKRLHETAREDMQVGLKKVGQVFLAMIIQTLFILCFILAFLGFQHLVINYYLLFTQNLFTTSLLSAFFIIQFFAVLYLQTLFVFLLPLIVIEKNDIITAIKNNIVLVWNHWWRVFSLQATPWVTYILILILIKWALGINIHVFLLSDQPHSLGPTILNTIILAFWTPWVAATMLVQLRDLELRKKLQNNQ